MSKLTFLIHICLPPKKQTINCAVYLKKEAKEEKLTQSTQAIQLSNQATEMYEIKIRIL
jgi:hypothetical protein